MPRAHCVQLLVLLARPCPARHTHTPSCSVSVSVFAHAHCSALVLPAGDVWRVGSGHEMHAPVALPGLYVPRGHKIHGSVAFARAYPAARAAATNLACHLSV